MQGHLFLTGPDDEARYGMGVWQAWRHGNLRYSQIAPLTMYKEKNTGTNLPAPPSGWQHPSYGVARSRYWPDQAESATRDPGADASPPE